LFEHGATQKTADFFQLQLFMKVLDTFFSTKLTFFCTSIKTPFIFRDNIPFISFQIILLWQQGMPYEVTRILCTAVLLFKASICLNKSCRIDDPLRTSLFYGKKTT